MSRGAPSPARAYVVNGGTDDVSVIDIQRHEGAFEQTIAGLRALLVEAPIDATVDVACTVVAANLDHLTALVDLVVGCTRQALLTMRFVAPATGCAADDWPAAAGVSTAVAAALDVTATAGADVRAVWEGFAPCLLPDHGHLRDD